MARSRTTRTVKGPNVEVQLEVPFDALAESRKGNATDPGDKPAKRKTVAPRGKSKLRLKALPQGAVPEVARRGAVQGALRKSRTRETSKAKLARVSKRGPEEVAHVLAGRQREISVSEFFAKNRHLLGFDNPAKALLTTVKEAVDNALDACEEAKILPEIRVEITQIREDRFCVAVEDNGPGIVRKQVPKIFGKLLYGSKFHTLKQSRGQQGIGISAAGMYGLLTTGKPVLITSRTGPRSAGRHYEVAINTKKNAPDILREEEVDWAKEHGTRVEITLQGTYKKGRHSIDGYLRQVAVANPHARLVYMPPVRNGQGQTLVYERTSEDPPEDPKEIRPHPQGVELGILLKMLQETSAKNLRGFLQGEFSRVGNKVISDLFRELAASGSALTPKTRPKRLSVQNVETLHSALARVKIMAPPTDCLSPIGEELLLRALESRVQADFYTTVARPPAVYRGNPFQIEVGLAYGGELAGDELAQLYRYANRVPLQYQRGACAMTKAVIELPWRNYRVPQSRGTLPTAPMILAVHIASVWVPFTSESKEAVAHYPEILQEIRRALQECGRRLSVYVRRRRRMADEHKKRSYIQKYIPQIGIALQEILGLSDRAREKTITTLTDILERSRKM